MKKILLVSLTVLLLAAGCNSPQLSNETTNTQILTPPKAIPSATPTSTTTPSKIINGKLYTGNGFTIQYPKTWVLQNHGCSDMGGISCNSLAPTDAIAGYKQKYGNEFLSLSSFSSHATKQSPQDWSDAVLGIGSSSEQQEITINGYAGLLVKTEVKNSYTDYDYIVEHNGLLVFFTFRSHNEAYPAGKSIQIDDYSEYLSEFQSIVYSIRFTK